MSVLSDVMSDNRVRSIKEYPFDFSDLNDGNGHTREAQPRSDKDSKHSKSSGSRDKENQPTKKISISEKHNTDHKSKKSSNKSSERNSRVSLPSNMTNTNPDGSAPQSILSNTNDPNKRKVSKERKVSNIDRKVSIMANEQDKEKIANERNGRVSVHQAEGPSRRKSNLHNYLVNDIDNTWDRHPHIEGKFKKYSTTSTIYSKRALSQQSEHIERSWWYACCAKCHHENTDAPSWEPPNWQKVCPYPFCPSYRSVSRIITICLIGVFVWLTLWLLMGKAAAPGGQLFSLALLTITAYLGGIVMLRVTKLPPLLGMLLVGVILRNIGFVHFENDYLQVVSYIRKIALTILLIRAGMDLDPNAMKKHFLTVIKLSLIPWTFEFALFGVLAYYLLGLPSWDWAFLLASIIAAVSPAVVVSCLLRLRSKGYGVSKGIPTLVLAVSGIDDAASVAVFGIISSIVFSTSSSVTMTIIQGPLSVVVGIATGAFLGYFVKFVPERNDAFLVPLRILFVLFGGIICMLGFEEIGWGGAGPLAVITFAFVAYKNWADLGWDLEDNPALTSFEIFWMFFEPMLFSVTGMQVVIAELTPHMVLVGGGVLLLCMVSRAVVTSLFAVKSNLNLKEKVFVGLSWMAKATVQAALAPVAMDHVRKMGGDNKLLHEYAHIVTTMCVLSIVITAPIGAIVIIITGPKLLSRTTKPPMLEGWRRSNRPSIRDISIIDEEDFGEKDSEMGEDNSRPESPTPKVTPPSGQAPPIVTQPNSQSS